LTTSSVRKEIEADEIEWRKWPDMDVGENMEVHPQLTTVLLFLTTRYLFYRYTAILWVVKGSSRGDFPSLCSSSLRTELPGLILQNLLFWLAHSLRLGYWQLWCPGGWFSSRGGRLGLWGSLRLRVGFLVLWMFFSTLPWYRRGNRVYSSPWSTILLHLRLRRCNILRRLGGCRLAWS
jgi:hypothetical protein